MIKRLLMAMALALCAVAVSVADVKIKDLDGTNVEITFTFKDDAASEMNVIGSFDNWTVPGEAMTKNAAGLWEYTLKATTADEVTYKFYYKGSWIFDFKAPDKKDDGFGGNNGLIVVADVLANAGTGAGGAGAASAVADAYPSKLNFGMYTIIGSQSTFTTQGLVDKTQKGIETDTTGIKGKSYWKIGGTLLPGVTGWFEVKAMDSYQPVWAQDATGLVNPELDVGIASAVSGLIYNPVNYIGGGNPFLNSVKAGFETPKIVWETGYGYAKPQLRTAVLWQTVEERDANDGYMRFDLGPELRKLADWNLEATFAPNKMNGNYSFFGWVDVSRDNLKLDFQYDMKSAESTTLSKIFDRIYHQDFILAAKYTVAGVTLSGQGLLNLFSESDFAIDGNLAGELKASWAAPGEVWGVTGGYRFTGNGVELLYGDNDMSSGDTLGTKGTQRALLYISNKPMEWVKLGMDTSATLTTAGIPDKAVEFYAKPWVEMKLDGLLVKKGSFNAYAKAKYNLLTGYQYDASQAAFLFGEAGAKLYLSELLPGTLNSLDLTIGYNNWDQYKTLTTAIASFRMPKDLGVELGFGLRTPHSFITQKLKDENNLLAFTVGGSWKIPSPAIKTPLIYGAFVYNMDPYDDNTPNLKMSDYVTDGGAGKNDGKANLRLMIKWDF